ncbi:MAG: hypothetical protein KDE48_09500 [Anaerolineales bacterium]|nr:hypothetical protein [Anaerolineales bacterium]MCA9949870.1 hypothetical protein [Anaerolineales bacterium]
MRKKTTIFTVVLFTLGAALALWGVLANTRALEPQMQAGGTPNLISYQGYLTDDSGQPINGAPDLEFGIYAALTGGSPLWSELQLNVPVNEGYFTVQLGSFTPIDADLFSDPDRYLQVSVNSGGGFVDLPRQPFTAVPYALQAANAWSLDGNSGTDPATHKLGTTDAVTLTLVMSDTAVMRFAPAFDPSLGELAPNITANPFSNEIRAGAFGSTISGGMYNDVTEKYATVGGGIFNEATDNYATVGGGIFNKATGDFATVGGGADNVAAGDYSYAAGHLARALHNGAFVWSDSSYSYFDSTGVDQFLIEADGGMGVGTNAPATQLHVVAARNGGANMTEHVVAIENNATDYGSGPDVLALKITNQIDPGSSANYITFTDADGGVGSVEGNGAGGVIYKTGGADFAEYLPLANLAEKIEPGAVVGLSQGHISQQTAGAERLFVVSTAAGFVGNAVGDEPTQEMALVALMGQVAVQVRGDVQVGDYIVASGLNDGWGTAVPLAALRAEQVSQVVGVALEPAADGGQVLALVGLPYDAIWQALLQARDAQLAAMEARLTALEQAITEDTPGVPGEG